MTSRAGFRFSADGRIAACLAVAGPDRAFMELWTLTGLGPRRLLRTPLNEESIRSHALPVAGDRLLLSAWRHDRPQLTLLGHDGELATGQSPGQRIVLSPNGYGLALGIAGTPGGGTELHLIDNDLRPARAPLAVTDDQLHGQGVVAGHRMVFYAMARGAAVPVVADLAAGTVTRLALPPEVRGAIPVCASGDTLLLAVSLTGRHGLVATSFTDPARVDLLSELDSLDGLVKPLALDPDGTGLLLRIREGARTRLVCRDLATGQTREIVTAPGSAGRLAAWSPAGLWLPYTTPAEPAALWWLPPGQTRLRRARAEPRNPGHPARIETFAGPAGPIEAVVYGKWRTADRVVLALHGGPAEHWSLTYDPALQALAQAGLAVVAPNPRGSTGYGHEHELAIKGAWGGPDLADVLAVATYLAKVRAPRPPAAVYGTSYGAFLALLAMAEAPHLWSRCVAIAPFRSAAALYTDAGPQVRALLDRLDGTAGPRDLVRLAPRMRGQIRVVHGLHDPVIPVRHSRELVAALRSQPGVTVTYRELPGGHQPLRPGMDDPEYAEIVRFLGR